MHIGLILDGNRRWAKSRGLPTAMGHKKGIDTFQAIIEHASEIDRIETISAFALSTENLKRDQSELDNLFRLFLSFEKRAPKLVERGARIRFFGNLALLPVDLRESFTRVESITAEGTRLTVNICVAFGGRDEIVRGVSKLIESGESVSEQNLARYLDSVNTPEVDLIIRTGGQRRISNFMIWEAAYAELYFTDLLWPEFSAQELHKALDFFDEQKRNFGK